MISCDVLCLIVVPPPGKIKFLTVKPDSVVLSWGCPTGLEGPKRFRVKWRSSKTWEDDIVIKDFQRIEIDNLQLGQQYFFNVATEDKDGNLSEWVKASVFTGKTFHIPLTAACSHFTECIERFYLKGLLFCSGASSSTLNQRAFRGHDSVFEMDQRRQNGADSTSIPYNCHKSRARAASNTHQRLLQDVL